MNSDILKNIKEVLKIEPGLSAGQYLVEFCKKASSVFGYQYILVASPNKQDPSQVDTIVAVAGGQVVPNFSYDLKDTPCENVASGNRVRTHYAGVAEEFPKDFISQELYPLNKK